MKLSKFIALSIIALMLMLALTACEGPEGLQGQTGKDGETPTVEIINGTWWINGVDTGIPVTGEQGPPGEFDPNCEHLFGFTNWVTVLNAVCGIPGLQGRVCYACLHKETRSINALSHTISWTTILDPTCTTLGEREGICTRTGCDQIFPAESYIVLGHLMNWTTILETCTTAGEREGFCTRTGCDFIFSPEVFPQLGHTVSN